MSKKRWALLVVIVFVAFVYIKLFYKSFTVKVVVKTADCIVAVDVKRITNTLLWNIITTPGQWKNISFSSGRKDTISWRDMVNIPDYILAFHVSGQPAGIWYMALRVKNENDFQKGLQYYHFEKTNTDEYTSKDLGIRFFKKGDEVLVTNNIAENDRYLTAVADELFIQKEFIAEQSLQKAIDAKSHLAIYLAPGNFLKDAAVISGNFDKTKIEIKTTLTPNKQFSFTENNFSYSASSLCTLGFTQPSHAVYGLLSDSNIANFSKLLNFNADSLLLPTNKYYQLDLTAIKQRVDSAITYSYDDNFNKVEKVVVNTIQEPAFNFVISGDSADNTYRYFLRSSKFEQTAAGQLFTAMPFVKSYCSKKSEQEINITAANYQLQTLDKTFTGIFFLNILLTKIPNGLVKFLPDGLIQATANIESIQIKANKQINRIFIDCIIDKKKNNHPIISN